MDAGVQPGVTGESDADTQAAIHQREVATYFILGADKNRFGKLQCDLQDNFARGTNQFPMTLTAAYNLLLTTEAAISTTLDVDAPDDNGGLGQRYCGGNRNNTHNMAGNTGNKHVKQANPAGHTGLYTSPCFPHGAVLLDTGATAFIIGGLHLYNYMGTFHGLQQPLPIWYAPDSVGSILALCDVQRLCRVMLDTATEAAFLVHLPDNTVLCFVEHTNGLYLLVPSVNPTTKLPIHSYSCVSTVADNRAVFTRQELEGADREDNSIVPSDARHSENLRPSWTTDPSSTVLLPKQMHNVQILSTGLTSHT